MRSLPLPGAVGCGYCGTCGCASVVRRSPGRKQWEPCPGGGGSQISDPAALPETSTYASGRAVTLPEAAACQGTSPVEAANKTLAGVRTSTLSLDFHVSGSGYGNRPLLSDTGGGGGRVKLAPRDFG